MVNPIKAALDFERQLKPIKISKRDREYIKAHCEAKERMLSLQWLDKPMRKG